MPLNPKELASAINDAIAATDKDEKAISVTPEMETYAEAIINTIKTSGVTHPLVQGTAPPAPGPVSNLQASNGTFLPPLNPAAWTGTMSSGFVQSNPAELSVEAVSSTSYIQGAAQIVFGVGTMQGNSTAAPGAPPVPGVLVFLNGSDGKISGLDGASWASSVMPPGADVALSQKIYTAIVDYIQQNAEVIYPAGTVNGSFAAPGTPLVGGIGIGGMII